MEQSVNTINRIQHEKEKQTKNKKVKDLDRKVMIKQYILPKTENQVLNDIDMKNLQIWSWNINGIRAVIKKNRI